MRLSVCDNSNIKETANRCLSCKNPSCEQGCPIHNHIRDFIKAIKDDNLDLAKNIVYDNSILAFICSIVCPHEKNCEGHCILNKAKKEPVNIGAIEGYITSTLPEVILPESIGKKVAVIGGGPAGIYAAIELKKAGIDTTIYERYNHLGGVLSYGIPDFRLGVDRLKMIDELIDKYQIEVIYNANIDETKYNELLNNYDYIIVACGLSKSRDSGLGKFNNLLEASEVLRAYNLKAKYNEGNYPNISGNVFVMGAGNVAMDVSRVAKKLGCNTTIVYRRSLEESPANREEIEAAKNDGVIFRFLENPVKVEEKDNKLILTIEQMELGEPDSSGRRRPVGTGKYINEEVDYLIEAIGDIPGIKLPNILSDHGYIIANDTFETSNPKVYAIGDITLGAKTVVEACYSAKACAMSIIDKLK